MSRDISAASWPLAKQCHLQPTFPDANLQNIFKSGFYIKKQYKSECHMYGHEAPAAGSLRGRRLGSEGFKFIPQKLFTIPGCEDFQQVSVQTVTPCSKTEMLLCPLKSREGILLG